MTDPLPSPAEMLRQIIDKDPEEAKFWGWLVKQLVAFDPDYQGYRDLARVITETSEPDDDDAEAEAAFLRPIQ